MTEIDASAASAPALTELQRNAYAVLAAAARLCDSASLALVPGPTSVAVYVPQRGRPGRYTLLRWVDLPQIKSEPLGRHAPRRSRGGVTP